MSRSQQPREIDGALRMVGELSGQLTKSKKYKKDVEKLLDAHIIGRLSHSTRFIRARAAWCIKQYSNAQFNTPKILKKIIEILVKRLCDPQEELPVKVESALAIQMLLDDQQDKGLLVATRNFYKHKHTYLILKKFPAHNMVKPFVQAVIPQVMELVAKTQIEDVVGVMDELLEQFMEDIIPIAADVAERLASFMFIYIFLFDFYDDILLLMQSLMQTYVSEPMWIVFNDLYAMFKKDNPLVTFSDVAPVLHLYITTDTEGFLARPERLNAVLDMCRVVLQDTEQGDENHLYAAKLLECLILQCNGAINEV
uniref:Adaptin_N domain-containing protein n=1 Tax=Heterorhabditis bacteriophora TaxID=37862 RepID=A0A1I7X447_HETBA